MTRKVLVGTAAVALLMCGALASGHAQTASARCNNTLIRGDYGFTIEGQKLGGPGPIGPQAGVAMTTFDGDGNLTQTDSVTINGVHVADFTHPPASGSYTVNADCTGTFSIHFNDGRPTVTVDFVVVANGDEIDTVVVPPPGAAVGVIATRSIGKRRFLNRGQPGE
ncbi:MAG TPA: hypothetical protein VGU90_06155 [Terriglobales bacterium]|nr:hypothetical protein [Terriglobales bacterium]